MKRILPLLLLIVSGGAPLWATVTPQLTVDYKNVISLNTGTNYYGPYWTTNASIPAYAGSTLTNLITSAAGTTAVVYRSEGAHAVILKSCAYQQPVETLLDQFQLGDIIPFPDNIADTNQPPVGFVAVQVGNNPTAYYMSTNPSGSVIYLPDQHQVVAAAGGNVEITWATTNGNLNMVYVISDVPSERPARVFWTEVPYNAPAVSLAVNGQEVFATIHYNTSVTRPTMLVTSNLDVEGHWQLVTQLLNGVWIDGSGLSKVIRADGVEGVALLEYYADGNYSHSLGVQSIQIMPPQHLENKAVVGQRLLPQDLYYGTTDLIPKITAGGGSDGKVYQVGLNGPKYNWLYAIRESRDNPWDVEVYWQHSDMRGVIWPFEVDWYEIEWPADPQHYVISVAPPSGPGILVPDQYTIQIPFQEPDNNAFVPSGKSAVYMPAEGLALIQYNNESNVWFDVIQAVRHDDRHYFNREPIFWPIGQEITPYNVNSYAVQLDGLHDYISRPYAEPTPTNFTLEIMFRTTGTQGGKLAGFGNQPEGASPIADRHVYMDNAGRVYFGIWNGSAYRTVASTNTYNDGQWHHAAAVYDRGPMRLYLDGQLIGTNQAAFTNLYPGGGYWRLGYDNLLGWPGDIGNAHFAGVLDEFRLWDKALTQSQITNLIGQPLHGTEPYLVACCPFEDGSGVSATDRTAEKNLLLGGAINWVAGYAMAGTVPESGIADWMEFPGYIYPAEGQSYNVHLYTYPAAYVDLSASHIFPVHSNGCLEVWWANRTANEDMPEPVYYPSRVERYVGRWPDPGAVPQIVLASGHGSAGASTVRQVTNTISIFKNDTSNWSLLFDGVADYASAADSATLRLSSNLTLEAWVNPESVSSGYRIIAAKGSNEFTFGLSTNNCLFFYDRPHARYYYSSVGLAQAIWSHAAVTFDYNNRKLTFYVNGGQAGQFSVTGNVAASGTGILALGREGELAQHYFSGALDEFRLWNIARAQTDIQSDMNERLGGTRTGLETYYYMEEGTGTNLADHSGNNNSASIFGADWLDIVTYSNRNLVVVNEYTDEGTNFSASPSATIYYQNDPSRPGFNPNEEHALLLSGIAYALRCDLNRPGDPRSSPPYVLVQYSTTDSLGENVPAMQVFSVVPTNAFHAAFTNSLVAGTRVQPPMPLASLPGVDNTNSTCFTGPGWRDRKQEWWAKSAGNDGGPSNIVMHYWYATQTSFFFPDRSAQPPAGTYVPWLSGGYSGTPTNYTYSVAWPENVPTLKLAQTLYKSPANSGLPDIAGQLSVDLIYQQSAVRTSHDSVKLIDPLVRRGAALDDAVIQQMDAAGLAVRQSPGRTYTFPGAPPSLQSRLVYDPDQPANLRLSLIGEYVETLTDGYLLLNLLEGFEYDDVLHLADDLPSAIAGAWQTAVDQLPRTPLLLSPNQPFVKPALSAGLGEGVGYVTVAFNNATNPAMVPSALPISLSIFRVVTNLYDGAIEVVASDNPLDEKLTLRQQADFGGKSDAYYFQWRTLPPTAEGLAPTNAPPDQWLDYAAGAGVAGITIEGATIQTLVDNWFITRHRALDSTNPAGTNVWSQWMLGFGPGWIQRALNGITPFEQRLTDMTDYGVDTTADMISEAGGPYNGPVALNMANINDYGLIEIYETLLERARMLSIDANFQDPAADSALMLAAGRLSDLYMVLGNEAYADAIDPTIAFGTADQQYGSWATSLFCFQNQLRTLLDEELALLRGRDSSLYPPTTQGPFYNRLPWNLTRDETGGEVAYALNYNLIGDPGSEDPVVSAEDAKAAYPQGHGDAWGHYLSAIGHYYELLRNPNFDWIPGIDSMLLGGSGNLTVSVDYYDEQKFAEAAAARARTGADIVNRTYRKFYTESQGTMFPGYQDEDPTRAWGVSEWASRVGQAAYYDWATANSLLPETASETPQNWALSFTNPGAFADLGTHSLADGSEMTLEFWVQSIALSNSVLFGGATTEWDLTPKTNLFLMLADGRVAWYSQHDRQVIYSTTVVGDGTWHHVAFVYDAVTNEPERKIIVDGGLEAWTPTRDIYWNNWTWSLGGYQEGAAGPVRMFFNGNLDDIRIWQRALTPAEIVDGMDRVLTGSEPGLLSYYSCLEGSGTVLHDRAGSNQGTLLNVSWIEPGDMLPFTNAMSGSLLATVPHRDSMNHDGGYCVESWVNYKGGSKSPVLVQKKQAGGASQYDVQMPTPTNRVLGFCGGSGGAGGAPALSSALPTGRWVHVAVSVAYLPSNNTSRQEIYLNGLLNAVGVQTGQTYNVTNSLQIGVGWTGLVNEIRIWKYARSGAEIAADFRRQLTGQEASLIAYYRADAADTNALRDLSTNRLHGTGATGLQFQNLNRARPPEPVDAGGGAAYPGILNISRTTVPELYEIAANGSAVQTELNNADRALNPLGLAQDVIPFDISATGIDDGKTHFEQVYDRARTALNNAVVAFDYAQGASLKLRAQADSMYNLATSIAQSELDYHDKLIEIFGYPYSDDIGPSGTYPQGYDGPDLVNYNILDLENLIGTAPTGQPVQVVLKNLQFVAPESGSEESRKYTDYILREEPLPGNSNAYEYANYVANGCTVTIYVAENGLQAKPPSWTGRRQAQGTIQIALSQYVQAFYQLQQTVAQFESQLAGLKESFDKLQSTVERSDEEWELTEDHKDEKINYAGSIAGMEEAKELGNAIVESGMQIAKQTCKAVPQIIAGGAGAMGSPVAVTMALPGEIEGIGIRIMEWAKILGNWSINSVITALKTAEEAHEVEYTTTLATNNYASTIKWAARDFEQALTQQNVVQAQLFQQIQNLSQMEEAYRALIAQGQRLITQRAQMRARAGQQIQYARYFDMAFRLFRNEQLQKYGSAFDLAARYAYLAAKAYDYETGLLSSDTSRAAGRRFLGDVVRARAIGLVQNGEPQPGNSQGDPGLADILARMKANWDVLQSQFGFNNPETEISRFSLRTELMRIVLNSSGDTAWQNALNSMYRIPNLYDLPEFKKYCKPFSSTTNREPALVIPFETVIMSRKNFFKHDLAGGDGAYDPSHAATKIRSMGVWFFNYNTTYNTNSSGGGLASEPRVYLVPVGADVERSPTDVEELRSYAVVDQAMPVPYPLENSDLLDAGWVAVHDSLSGNLAEIRRYPSLRAYFENNANKYTQDEGYIDPAMMISNARLVGRSVWNTRWLLIIPGSTLLADPDEGLNRFIFGAGTGSGPEQRDGNGVKDIRILFHTYSVSGR